MIAVPPWLRPHLHHAGREIIYSDLLADTLPPVLHVGGLMYQRFLDFIYLPCDADELTAEQVVVVSELRARYLARLPSRTINEEARCLLGDMIGAVAPVRILEVGPGYEPLLPPSSDDYFLADLDPHAVEANAGRGYRSVDFALDARLALPTDSVDLIVALFVLHFPMSESQIGELARVLNLNGVIVANVYRRSTASRRRLLSSFGADEFQSLIYPDHNHLCRGHEYWCLYRERGSALFRAVREFFERLSATP